MTSPPHIAVCVCTYRRRPLLGRLLGALAAQETRGLFTYSVVVVDNDHLQSASSVVADFAAASPLRVVYCVEPRQNIPLARNKAVANAHGDFVAFIDDDEIPTVTWLVELFTACTDRHADGALGPVKPQFSGHPPDWVVRGRFYERRTYPTGLVIGWRQGRTGNVLLKSHLFASTDPAFRPMFLTGEDQDFFRRMIEQGHRFVWCNEAVAYEDVPPARWTRRFMLRRALLRGAVSLAHPTTGWRSIAVSVIAVAVYAVVLPFTLPFGHHTFMRYLIKLCDHLGKVLAVLRITPVRDPYVTS
jgi:glycosyltransferase involved in cell wall biosynthesis